MCLIYHIFNNSNSFKIHSIGEPENVVHIARYNTQVMHYNECI